MTNISLAQLAMGIEHALPGPSSVQRRVPTRQPSPTQEYGSEWDTDGEATVKQQNAKSTVHDSTGAKRSKGMPIRYFVN